MLEIRLLGQFDLRRDGETLSLPSRPAQSLLAYLLLNPGVTHRREQLAGLMAPDADETTARTALRRTLWRIRKTLGSDPVTGRDYLQTDEMSVAWDPTAAVWLDAAVAGARLPPDASLDALAAALSAYGGDLLPGFYEDWVVLERERLEAAFEGKLRLLLERLGAAGQWAEVIEWAEKWISLGHTPESAYAALMTAHAARGDGSRVASVYRRCVDDLRDGLGVAPSEATTALYERLQRGEGLPSAGGGPLLPVPAATPAPGRVTAPPRVAAAPAPGPAPFKGLQAFQVTDAALFFGREALTARLVDHLRRQDVLAVVGASGSGKSSVVRAGLVPALMRGETFVGNGRTLQNTAHWAFRVMTPTGRPLQELALAVAGGEPAGSMAPVARLADDMMEDPRSLALHLARWAGAAPGVAGGEPAFQRHMLLVVDQLEEVFTLCPREEERAAFIGNLLAAVPGEKGRCGGPLTLVFTLRADFYAQCAAYPELRTVLESSQQFIGAMDSVELRRCIEGPLQAGDWQVEPGLVDLIVRDAGSEPGALPLLSHALLETWCVRAGRMLTLQGYASTGGVRGAIARTADTVFGQFDDEEQRIARRIFLRLTALGEGTQETRRRVSQSELLADPATQPLVESVLETLAAARLATVGDEQVEISHEALIREWPLLRRWLNEDREGIRLHHRLAEAAESWEASGRDGADLYRGARLAQAAEWAARHPGDLNPLERAFLEASQAEVQRAAAEGEAHRQRELEAAQRLAEAERAQAEKERQRVRQLRQWSVVLASALVLVVALAVVALWMSREARQAAALARNEQTLSYGRELAASARASMDEDPERSLLLALEAVETARQAGLAPPAEVEGVLRQAVQASRLDGVVRAAVASAVSPEALLAAVNDGDGRLAVWDLALARLPDRGGEAPRYTLPLDAKIFAFSRDGQVLAAADLSGRINVYEAQTGAVRRVLDGHADGVSALRLSADGSRLLSMGADGTVRTWDVASGEALHSFFAASGLPAGVDLSADGSRILLAPDASFAHVCDPVTGDCPLRIATHDWGLWGARFCGRGETFVVGSYRSFRVWDIAGGLDLLTRSLADADADSLACSPDGLRVAAGGKMVRVWDASTGEELLAAPSEKRITRLEFTADSARLTGYDETGAARIWELQGGRELAALAMPLGASDVAFSPDDALLVSGSGADTMAPAGNFTGWRTGLIGGGPEAAALDRDAGFWQPAFEFLGRDSKITRLAFSPRGDRLATGSVDGYVRIWRAGPGGGAPVEEKKWTAYGPRVADVAWDAGGRRIAIAQGAALRVWEVDAEKQPKLLYGLRGLDPVVEPLALAWSRDGRALAVGLNNGLVRVVDGETGEVLAELSAHAGAVQALAISPDGARLATAGIDGVAAVWDPPAAGQTGAAPAPALSLRGGEGALTALAWSPDGALLATGGQEGAVRVWDAAAGEQRITLNSGAAPVTGIAWSADGRLLATAGDAVRVFVMRQDDLLALARRRVSRELTQEERRQYLSEDVSVRGAGGGAGVDLAARLPLTTPLRAGEDTATADETQVAVNNLLDMWRVSRDAVSWVFLLFTNPLEFQMGPFYSTDANVVYSDIAYWGGQDGVPSVESCDAPQGRTVRCDLVIETACDRWLGLGPWRLDTTFTVSQGRVEKMIAAAPAGQLARWAAAMENALVWGRQQSARGSQPYSRLLNGQQLTAWEAGRLTGILCEMYAQAHPPASAPAATATPVR